MDADPPAYAERRIRLALPDIGAEEIEAISQVLQSGVLTGGAATVRFERQFADYHSVSNGVAFANGTVALTALYLALGIGPGDEVIVPSMTFISSATSVLHAGARPVFADIRPDTFNLDPVDVARRITTDTKAILAVHYGGQPCDMAELSALASDAGVVLLEDAAEAHGASYHGAPVGGLGRAAMFSFTPTKNITTGEGGMITTDDGALAQTLRLLRNHGQSAHYYHQTLGYNWRLTEMQAAMGCVQLAKLSSILARKQANAAVLYKYLSTSPELTPPATLTDRSHVFMLYTILVDRAINRDSVLRSLNGQGIEARLYFPPVHHQPIFRSGAPFLPVTEAIAERMVSVPFHSLLSRDNLLEIATALGSASSAARRPTHEPVNFD